VGAYKMAGMPGDFEKELSFCAQAGRGGFVVFHYGSLLQNPALAASVSRLARAE